VTARTILARTSELMLTLLCHSRHEEFPRFKPTSLTRGVCRISERAPARFSAALPLSISVNTSTCQSAKTRPPYPKKLATPAFALYLARERREFHRGGRYWWAYRASISEYPVLSKNVESLSAFARLRSSTKIASNRPSANASEKARLLAA